MRRPPAVSHVSGRSRKDRLRLRPVSVMPHPIEQRVRLDAPQPLGAHRRGSPGAVLVAGPYVLSALGVNPSVRSAFRKLLAAPSKGMRAQVSAAGSTLLV